MRKVDLEKQAKKFVKKLSPKQSGQIARKIVALKEDVQPQDAKRLHGVPMWRVDIGEYRIVYDYDDTTVYVYVIGKRNDSEVYRLLQRKLRG